MDLKTVLREEMEREYDFLCEQEVGSEDYIQSLKRLGDIQDKLSAIEQFESESATKVMQLEDEKKDRRHKNIIDIAKTILCGVIVPGVGLVCITATEKNTTFCGALKDYTKLFIPKKFI